MTKKENLLIIVITVMLYLINRLFKEKIPPGIIKFCLSCYFNDVVGSTAFVAYSNFLLSYCNKAIKKLASIVLLMFFCGVFWEYFTPLIRPDTVTDILDILAYIFGGFVYWIIFKIKTF